MNVKDLQQLQNLASFSATRLEKLASNLSIKTYGKNEIVFDQDEEARFIYLLVVWNCQGLLHQQPRAPDDR